ncbi:dUTP diphosphatase [Lentibacillus sp. N15]|uniref:dUTP diphosphatase n=1 Tax=Lentibacillus songyuanensis TaxID=3136161 RepID=UPI0031BBBDF9
MDWNTLFTMQKQLDHYIEKTQEVTGKDLFQEKILALFVEIGELANETRCFKFWSVKPKSKQDIILAEYVDGLHFIMSLGLDCGYGYESQTIKNGENTVTEQFNHVFSSCILFNQDPSVANYEQLFVAYLVLGKQLGFDEEAVYQAYRKKNEINYERQDQGY